ncbi:MAG: NAD(P)H-dependent oxidoreductase, partial [Candidatus Micrarchaeota archaeon]
GNPGAPLGGPQPRVCILYGYPSSTSGHGSKILQNMMDTLQAAGAEFDVLNLYSMGFDPVMSAPEADDYGKNVPEDVLRAQGMLAHAPVWIIAYPVWWSSPPAMLKGFFDRVLTPGFAFSYQNNKSHPMLNDKRALVVRTYGGPAMQEQENGHAAHKLMENAILGFCGVKSVAVDIYSVSSLAPTAFNHALFQLNGAVRRVLSTPTGVPHNLRSVPAPYLPPIERMGKGAPRSGTGAHDEEEKPPLSQSAQEDLEFFKAAKKQAVENVHNRAGRSGGAQSQRRDDRGRFNDRNRRPRSPQGQGRSRGGVYSGREGGPVRPFSNTPRQGGSGQWNPGGAGPGNRGEPSREGRRRDGRNRRPGNKGRRF